MRERASRTCNFTSEGKELNRMVWRDRKEREQSSGEIQILGIEVKDTVFSNNQLFGFL